MINHLLNEFRLLNKAQGFDELLERRWEPNAVQEMHTHPFDANALVTEGEMWLTVGSDTQHLLAGDTFKLIRNTPHAERYGAAGATYWVVRRS